MLCQLSYRGRQPRDCSRALRGAPAGRTGPARRRTSRACVASPSSASRCSLASSCSLPAGSRPVLASPRSRSGSGPTGSTLVRSTASAGRGRRTRSSRSSGREGIRADRARRSRDEACARRARQAASRPARARRRRRRLGRRRARVPAAPLRPRRARGRRAVHAAARGVALRRYQSRRGLAADGIAGPEDVSLARRAHGDAGRDDLARRRSRARASSRSPRATTSARGGSRVGTGSSLMTVIVPNQRLALPKGARLTASPSAGPAGES